MWKLVFLTIASDYVKGYAQEKNRTLARPTTEKTKLSFTLIR